MAKEFGISGDIEIDNSHSFTYQIQVYFPTHFQKQVLRTQFDWYDSGSIESGGTAADTEVDIVDKITRNLGINKEQVVNTMSKYSEVERKKSILGQIKPDNGRS